MASFVCDFCALPIGGVPNQDVDNVCDACVLSHVAKCERCCSSPCVPNDNEVSEALCWMCSDELARFLGEQWAGLDMPELNTKFKAWLKEK